MVHESFVKEVFDFVKIEFFLISNEFKLLLILNEGRLYLFFGEHILWRSFIEYAYLWDHEPESPVAPIQHVVVEQVFDVEWLHQFFVIELFLFLDDVIWHLFLHNIPMSMPPYMFSIASLRQMAHLHPSFSIWCYILLLFVLLDGELCLVGDFLGDLVGDCLFQGWLSIIS